VLSIVRVVLITLVILYLADLLGSAFFALNFLIFLVILAIFVAYLLNPLVELIRRPFSDRNLDKLMPRPLAILISYLIVFGVLFVAIGSLAPVIGEQAREFAANLPSYRDSILAGLNNLNSRYEQLMLSPEVQQQVNIRIGSILANLGSQITTFVGNVAIETVTYLPWMIVVPVLAFFFLKDANVFRMMFLRCFPSGRWRARAESFTSDVNKTLAAYTQAQLISCFLIGFVCTVAFYILEIDYALLLGILAGILEFIPLLGPLTIAVTATVIAGFESPWQALWVAIFLILLRLTHAFFAYPRIVREGIHLHPLAVILSVLAGEQIAGISGVFLSIPVVALLTVLYKHILEHSGRKGLFAEIFGRDEVTNDKDTVTTEDGNESTA